MPMYYGIIDADGNVLGWFDDEGDARSALDRMAGQAGVPGDIAMVGFEDGNPVGEAEIRSAGTEGHFITFVTQDLGTSGFDAEIGEELGSYSMTRIREVVLN